MITDRWIEFSLVLCVYLSVLWCSDTGCKCTVNVNHVFDTDDVLNAVSVINIVCEFVTLFFKFKIEGNSIFAWNDRLTVLLYT